MNFALPDELAHTALTSIGTPSLPQRRLIPLNVLLHSMVPGLQTILIDFWIELPSGASIPLLVGPPLPVPPIPGLIDGSCDWIGLQQGLAVVLATSLAATFSVPLAVPNTAALEGELFHCQTLWWSPVGAPSFQLSNGLQLALGASAPH